MTTELTSATFDEYVYSSKLPVLVDFWAEWCGPCKRVSPIIDKLASQEDRIAEFAKVDVDKNSELLIRFELTSIPALLLFSGGVLLGRLPNSGLSETSITKNMKELLDEYKKQGDALQEMFDVAAENGLYQQENSKNESI